MFDELAIDIGVDHGPRAIRLDGDTRRETFRVSSGAGKTCQEQADDATPGAFHRQRFSSWQCASKHSCLLKNGITKFWKRTATALVCVPLYCSNVLTSP